MSSGDRSTGGIARQGKADWLARGLPREGSHANAPRVIDLARQDAVTCGLTDAISAVRDRVDASPYDFALVLADGRVLLGRLGGAALRDDAAATVEAVMDPGPSTVRADADLSRLRERLERQNLPASVVTDPEGRLLGIVRRADLPTPQARTHAQGEGQTCTAPPPPHGVTAWPARGLNGLAGQDSQRRASSARAGGRERLRRTGHAPWFALGGSALVVRS